jgi:hypothetical protein
LVGGAGLVGDSLVVVVVVGAEDSELLLGAALLLDAAEELGSPTSAAVDGTVATVLGSWVTNPAPPPAPTVSRPSHPATSTTVPTASRSERMTIVVRGTAKSFWCGVERNKGRTKP